MKELSGSAAQTVNAPIESCYELLAAVDAYPSWYPDVVQSVEVLERAADGAPVRAEATLHVARGPLVKDFHLLLAVELASPNAITLIRQRHGPSDQEDFRVAWQLSSRRAGTEIALALDANLSVPRLVPLGSIGDALAGGFVTAAAGAVRRSR
jgi:ribosome-associated toxin RatA of RatAB toxin-antitoxin module